MNLQTVHDKTFDPSVWMSPDAYGLTPELEKLTTITNFLIDSHNTQWLDNVETNLHYLVDDNMVADIFGAWQDERVLVVGAGPSTNKNIESIKNAQESGFKIVVCDRAHEMLLSGGIQADIYVTADSALAQTNYAKYITARDAVVCSPVQHPEVIDMINDNAGEVFYYLHSNPFSLMWQVLWERLPHKLFSLKPGNVIGFTAVDLAVRMGAKEVAMIGMDCCWHSMDEIEDCYTSGVDKIVTLELNEGKVKKYTVMAFVNASMIFRYFNQWYPWITLIDCSGGIMTGVMKIDLENILWTKN
jgi:hypothetical protein